MMNTKRIAICYGTRPEYIKVKPVFDQMIREAEYFDPVYVYTGQHEDVRKLCTPHKTIPQKQVGSYNRLDQVVSNCLSYNLDMNQFDAVLVQGDTASAYAMALKAFHHNVPVIHLEAGMRTFDIQNPYPEEAYRQMISIISSLNLCPTFKEKQYLKQENVPGLISVVGNTVLDEIRKRKNNRSDNLVLITLHRRENEEYRTTILEHVNNVAKTMPDLQFQYLVHPKHRLDQDSLTDLDSIECIYRNVERSEFIDKLCDAAYVITDSGGVQEECSFLQVPCIVVRNELERTLCIGYTSLRIPPANFNAASLQGAIEHEQDHFKLNHPCPYGDGSTSIKVCIEIRKYLSA